MRLTKDFRAMSGMPECSAADVFITDELARRAPEKTDYFQEKLALQDLAARMADSPDEVLPRFVALAMRMTGGVSAGISLYEENPPPGVFRWHHVCGTLSLFEGVTTPRDFSPCGITLDRNTVMLATHPERAYTWIADANLSVPEVLLVPLYIGGQTPLGTLWIVSDRLGNFDSGHARAITDLATFVGIALRVQRDGQRLRRALDEQKTLTGEMSHRVKNLFAVADSMIRTSARNTATTGEMARVLSGRLRALATAHTLIRRDFSAAGADARTADLGAVIQAIVTPHESGTDGASPRFSLTGPSIECGDHAINGIALVFHELATNAVKYGSLRNDTGQVEINWRREGDVLAIRWTERGGSRIEVPPARQGFGSRLTHGTVVQQLQGTVDYDWQPDGLRLTLTAPILHLAN